MVIERQESIREELSIKVNFFTNYVFKLAGTMPAMVRRTSQSTQSKYFNIGIMVLILNTLQGLAMGYAFFNTSGHPNWIISVVAGVFSFFLFGFLYGLLLSYLYGLYSEEFSNKSVILRGRVRFLVNLTLSLILVTGTVLPLNMLFFENAIGNHQKRKIEGQFMSTYRNAKKDALANVENAIELYRSNISNEKDYNAKMGFIRGVEAQYKSEIERLDSSFQKNSKLDTAAVGYLINILPSYQAQLELLISDSFSIKRVLNKFSYTLKTSFSTYKKQVLNLNLTTTERFDILYFQLFKVKPWVKFGCITNWLLMLILGALPFYLKGKGADNYDELLFLENDSNRRKILSNVSQANNIDEESVVGPSRKEYIENELLRIDAQLKYDPDNLEVLNQKADRLKQLNREKEYYDILTQIDNLKNKEQFEQNLKSKFVIDRLEVKDFEFFGNFEWRLTPGINLLLGKNGYGKSHLLTMVVSMLQIEETKRLEFVTKNTKTAPTAQLHLLADAQGKYIELNRAGFKSDTGKVPLLAISELRSIDKSRDILTLKNTAFSLGEKDNEVLNDLKTYGAYHFLRQLPMGGLLDKFFYQLSLAFLKKNKDDYLFELYERVFKKLNSESKHNFKFVRIEEIGPTDFRLLVTTEDTTDNSPLLPVQKASQGTLSVVSILGLILNYLHSISPKLSYAELTKKPAIIIVDEIDAHLHPSWQQKIISILREEFPAIQFIITAHNPLIVAGCMEGEVSVMRKTEDGFTIQQFDRHFIGATANEMYQSVFELEEKDETYLKFGALRPFKQQYEDELQTIEDKYALTSTEEETYWLLREKVEKYINQQEKPVASFEEALKLALDSNEQKAWAMLEKKPSEEDFLRQKLLEDRLHYIREYERLEQKNLEKSTASISSSQTQFLNERIAALESKLTQYSNINKDQNDRKS